MQDNDLISRKALLNDLAYSAPELMFDKEYVFYKIQKQRSVDAVPVVHGRWETGNDVYNWYGRCSECGIEFNIVSYYASNIKYCPNCGAKMDKENDN